MWLLPDQVRELLREAGVPEAAPGDRPEVRLTLEIEPQGGRIRLGAAPPGWSAREDASGCATVDVDPRYGFFDAHGRELAVRAGLRGRVRDVPPVLRRLWDAFRELDLLRLETELAVGTGPLRHTGGRMLTDDNAFERNGRLARLREPVAAEPVYAMREHGIDYVELDGEVGLLSVGAGETMATMDLLEAAGSRAACFLDCSGGFGADAVTAALQRIQGLRRVRALLVNVFGGVTRVDGFAESVAVAMERIPGFNLPLVVRLEGTGADRGRELLAGMGLRSFLVLRDAVEAAVRLARRGEA
jgi:succinyl-CoA synthetase beta subunit